MVRIKDLLKIFLIYLCMCHVTPAHPCGHNPLRTIMTYIEGTGADIDEFLTLLEDYSPAVFRTLQSNFRNYAACVGMVDTGYYKRSSPPAYSSLLLNSMAPIPKSYIDTEKRSWRDPLLRYESLWAKKSQPSLGAFWK